MTPASILDWSVAGRPLDGETESGDAYIVAPFSGGVLVAVIDGLGHGPEAAMAAGAAASVLQLHAQEPVTELVRRCHEGLHKTRGVALSLASIHPANSTLSWIGVGNVEGFLIRGARTATPQREAVLLRGGVVGYRLPPLREATLHIEPDDTLVLATDGISHAFAREMLDGRPTKEVADNILREHAKKSDDALVLVARYLGASP